MTTAIRSPRAAALQGHRAGVASRLTADAVDWLVVQGLFFALLIGAGAVRFLFDGTFVVPSPGVGATLVMQWVLLVVYLVAGWAGTGRTLGKTIMGLRVVSSSGHRLTFWRALLRAALCTALPFIILTVVLSRKNLGWHDHVLRTAVVYDWTSA